MSEGSGFELEPDSPPAPRTAPGTAPHPGPSTTPTPTPDATAGAAPAAAALPIPPPEPRRVSLEPKRAIARRFVEELPPPPRPFERVDPRVWRRLKRTVPMLAATFLVVGWMFVGARVWIYPFAGAAVGVFAAYRRPSEMVLAPISGAAAYGASAAAVGTVPFGFGVIFVFGICGLVGALVAIDDRMAGSNG